MRTQIIGEAAIQGSPAWLELRKGYRTASEASIVLGQSPFQKVDDFKLVKAGLKTVFYSNAMKQGNDLEETVRQKAEEFFGESFAPQVWVNGDYLASLDSINVDGDTIIEIKVSKHTHSDLSSGILPKHYETQILQQMYCSGADKGYLVAMHPETFEIEVSKLVTEVPETFIEDLEKAWCDFEAMPIPELRDDIDMENNENWVQLAEEIKELDLIEKAAKARRDEIKARLIELAEGKNAHGDGVKLYYTKGRETIAYSKAIQALIPDADLSKYKTVSKPSWNLKVA